MANCAVCREDVESGKECRRCGVKDKGPYNLAVGYFGNIWAVLSFLLILAPLVMLVRPVRESLEEAISAVVSVRVSAPISLLLTMVFAFFLVSMRDDLHEEHLSRTFREKQRKSLPRRALEFFLVAVALIFLLGFVMTSQSALIGPGDRQIREGSFLHLMLKFVMTGCLVLMFSFLSLATGYMAVYEFGLYAEKHMPKPIYLNEQLMLDVVLEAVQQQLDSDAKVTLSRMRRTPDAGMELLLHQQGKLITENGEKLLEQKEWLVVADLWARLRTMIEHGTRTVEVKVPEKEGEAGKELVPASKPAS